MGTGKGGQPWSQNTDNSLLRWATHLWTPPMDMCLWAQLDEMKHPNCNDSHTLYRRWFTSYFATRNQQCHFFFKQHTPYVCLPPVLSTAGGKQSPRERTQVIFSMSSDTLHVWNISTGESLTESWPSFFSVITHSIPQQEIQLYLSYMSYCTWPLPLGGTTAWAVSHPQRFIHRRWTRAPHGSFTALLLSPKTSSTGICTSAPRNSDF